MNILAAIATLICISSLEIWHASAQTVPEQCGEGSLLICRECNKLYACAGTEPVLIKECPAGQTCITGECAIASSGNTCNPLLNNPIPCQVPGVFPDPFNCDRYHFCAQWPDLGTEWVSTPMDCNNTNTYTFNPRTRICDKRKPSNGQCALPIPICTLGSVLPLRENPNIYYICALRNNFPYPYQIACDNGRTFSTVTKQCN